MEDLLGIMVDKYQFYIDILKDLKQYHMSSAPRTLALNEAILLLQEKIDALTSKSSDLAK
jgi:hypothetical protein